MVFNLETKQVKWVKELDLSTDNANFRAYIYSSPTVVDLDGDGYLDILVGTSFGLFYAMDHHGKTSCSVLRSALLTLNTRVSLHSLQVSVLI